MRQELQQKLWDRYPDIFEARSLSMTQSCMYWGCECGNGWFSLLDDLCAALKREHPTVRASQVKEKFGTLRFYFVGPIVKWRWCERAWYWTKQRALRFLRLSGLMSGHPFPKLPKRISATYDAVEALVYEAERRSAITCEECGAPGASMTRGYWLRTSCEACAPEGYHRA